MRHKLWWVFAVILALGVTAHFMVRSAEDKVTDRMLSQADRFAIPADWKLTDETVRPERFMCISTNPCPSLFRRWKTGRELTDSDVTAVLAEVGFEMKADGPCERRPNVIGNSPICTSSGSDGELQYSFTLWSRGSGGPEDVVLEIRPRHVPDLAGTDHGNIGRGAPFPASKARKLVSAHERVIDRYRPES